MALFGFGKDKEKDNADKAAEAEQKRGLFGFFKRDKDGGETPSAADAPQSAPLQAPVAPAEPQAAAAPVATAAETATTSSADLTQQQAASAELAAPVPLEPVAAEPNAIPAPVVTPEATAAAPATPVQAHAEILTNSVAHPVDKPSMAKPAIAQTEEKVEKEGFFARIKKGLAKTGSAIGQGVGTILLGKKEITDELWEDLETQLLAADVGIDATSEILEDLTDRVGRNELTDGNALYKALQEKLYELLQPVEAPLVIDNTKRPYVILVVGVNGVGKTTTIGKLARRFQSEGKSVMLAAGDTFRAAAVEQLQVWGERNNVPVVAQHTGADSASVIFDALQAAKSRGTDVIIADTAGRLHNKSNLMEELKKVKRVMAKLDGDAPHEVLLVLDAGTGQNAINQAKMFGEAVDVTGIALTKLDGTAKGGVIFQMSKVLGVPVRFIGVGEKVEDLQVFNARDFVRALFEQQ